MIGWEPSDFNVKTRQDSFRNGVEEAGLDAGMTAFGELNIEGGYRATRRLMKNHKKGENRYRL